MKPSSWRRTLSVAGILMAMAGPASAQYPGGLDPQSVRQGTSTVIDELFRLPRTGIQADIIQLDARGFAEVHDSDEEFLGGRESEHINPETWQDLDDPPDLDDDDD